MTGPNDNNLTAIQPRCDVCGITVADTDNFCRYCGHALRRMSQSDLVVGQPLRSLRRLEPLAVSVRHGMALVALGAVVGALARSAAGRSLAAGLAEMSLRQLASAVLRNRRPGRRSVSMAEETIVIVRRSASVSSD